MKLWLVNITLLQLAIFIGVWYYYLLHPMFKCECLKYQQSFPIAKSSAMLININLFLIVMSRIKLLKRFMYISSFIIENIHKYFVFSFITWSLIHSVAHYINFITIHQYILNRLSYFNPAEALEFTDLNWEYPWTDRALNVSFLYLKNEKFKNYYCETAMEYMRKSYGKFPIPNTKEERNKPILFAEQYMLYQLVKKEQQETYLLIDDYSPMIRNLELFKSLKAAYGITAPSLIL